MNLLTRIKAVFDRNKWLGSTMTVVNGTEGKRQPFSYGAAVRSYTSWIHAAASINAIAVASQPLRLYVRNRNGQKKLVSTRPTSRRTKAYLAGDLAQSPSRVVLQKVAEYGSDYEVVNDSHPILDLLSKVNPYQNGFDATVLRVLYGELTGNAYVHPVIDRRLGIPVELWTMPSQFVEIVPGKEKFIDGYLYGASREQRKVFLPDEVIHFRRPNPSDLYYGIGKVEAAWGATLSNAAIHEMDLSLFANNARPDYLLTIKGDASPDELERFQAQVESQLQGKGRRGKFLAATAEIDLKPLSFPPKDIAGRAEVVEEIAAVFGVPVSMLKANDPNLASATTGYAMWRETTILPLLRMDEETLNQNLLPLFGIEDDAFLAYDNPVKADERFEFEKRRGLVAGGIITANEARALEGMEPAEDPMADALLVNGQVPGANAAASPAMTQVDQTGEPSAPIDPNASSSIAASGPVVTEALNGAQIASLLQLATSAQKSELPKDTAVQIAIAAFPSIPGETINRIFGPINPQPIVVESKSAMVIDGLVGPLDKSSDLDDPPAAPMDPVIQKDALADCVSDKIAKLIGEGYEQDQAVAIAYSMCSEGKGLEAAIGKAVEDVDTKPPQAVADNARRALAVRETKPESERGMTEVGIARARDLMNRENLSEDTIRRMLAYFERHEVDKQGETWDEQGKGWQAWNGWGGDEGFAWARRKVEEFDRARDTKSCGCGCAEKKAVSQKALWDYGTSPLGIRRKNQAENEAEEISEGERSVSRAVSKVLDKQVAEVIRRIEASPTPTREMVAEVEQLLRSRRWNKDVVSALRPYLLDAMNAGVSVGQQAVEKIAGQPVNFEPSNAGLRAYAESQSIRLADRAATSVNRYTSVRVSEVLGQGVADGETIPQLAARVREWAGAEGDEERATVTRSRMIARTEAQRAARTAEVEAWRQSGLVEGKTWLLAPDPCEFCEAAADAFAKNATGLDDAFYTKGTELIGADGGRMVLDYEDVQGPPLHPNCRCSMQPKLIDDDGLDAEMEAAARGETNQ